MANPETMELYRRTNRATALTMSLVGSVGTYFYARQANLALRGSFVLPAVLAYLPLYLVSYGLFVNKTEDAKFRSSLYTPSN